MLQRQKTCVVHTEARRSELHFTRRWGKITPKLVRHNCKRISSHEGTSRCNISRGHAPTTFSCVCTKLWFCPCYMSALHFAATSRLSVHYTSFLSLWLVAATWPSCLSTLKCPCDKKNHFLFSFRFWKCVCLTPDWQNFELWYPKAVYFECKFWISRSAITHVQNWPIGPQTVGSREKWRQRLTSLKFQRVNAAYYICKAWV